MTSTCPLCATVNRVWQRRCTSCRERLPVAYAVVEPTAEKPPAPSLATRLELDAAHVEALAAEGIHTLEHVAQAAPEKMARALWPWPHLDPEALTALARRLLLRA